MSRFPLVRKLERLPALSAVLLLFWLLQYLYAISRSSLPDMLYLIFSWDSPLSPDLWFSSPLLLLLDRLFYAAFFLLPAWLLCYRILPQQGQLQHGQPQSISTLWWPKGYWGRALLFGLGGGGLACLAILSLAALLSLLPDFSSQLPQPPAGRHSHLGGLLQDQSLLLWHLLFTAGLTAILEESAYRGSFQRFLEKESRSRLLPPLFSALLFALGHPQIFAAMLLPALFFSVLFWRWRLLSSIVAHAAYNGLILAASSLGRA